MGKCVWGPRGRGAAPLRLSAQFFAFRLRRRGRPGHNGRSVMKKVILTLLFCTALTSALRALTVAVSNLSQPVAATTFAIGKGVPAFDFQSAVSFTTGAAAADLESVTLSFQSRVGAGTGFTLGLYSNVSAAGPSGLITLFNGSSTPSTGLENYTPSAATQLQAGTTYWLVESSVTTAALTGFSLYGTTSIAEDAGAAAGWSIGNSRMYSNNGGGSWASATNGVLQFAVNTASVPEAGATLWWFGAVLAGLAGWRRRAAVG